MSNGGFPWGLTPGGTPEDDEDPVIPPGVPTAPPPAAPVDQGHFVALDPELSVTPPAEPVPSWDQPTQATPTYEPSYDQPIAPPSWEQPNSVPQSWEQPTQAVEAITPEFPAHAPAPWEPPPVDGSLPGATEALAAQPVGFDGIESGDATAAIDALFGEGAFQEYADELVPGDLQFPANPFAAKAIERVEVGPQGTLVTTVAPPVPVAPMAPLQKRLLIAAGGVVAALALVALFLVGTRMAPLFAAAPPEPVVPTAQPTLPPEVLGPVAPGVYAWNELLGTECLEPFVSPWEQEFTVVDCGQPHSAQLVLTGTFEDSVTDPYPGFDELQSRMSLLCSSAEGIDYAAAKGFTDIRISASFAATEAAWTGGDRGYSCFAQRAEGPLTGSIAVPDKPTPAIAVTPAPEP